MQDKKAKERPCAKKSEDINLGKRRRKTKKSEKCLKTKALELGFSPEEIKLLNRIYKEI